jgi:hypothetical protein
MTGKQVAPYGSWKSPISAEEVFAKAVGLVGVRLDGEHLYWSERRPDGRTVLVQRTPDGATHTLTPPDYYIRTRVHEYGGGDTLVAGGVVYFANYADQHLYRQVPGAKPELVAGADGMRYADFILDPARKRIISVREDHGTDAPQPVNTLVAVPLDGGGDQVLVAGNDFYASPCLSPDGKQVAWLTWNHPDMPRGGRRPG